jgi:cysteine synthase A
MMAALGAEVVLVDQAPGSVPGQVSGADLQRVEQEARRIVVERNGFRADQFNNASNARAHFLTTGPEIVRQAAGTLDAFCDFVGSGGSFAGCAAAFKQHKPAIQCFIVEPVGAAVLTGNAASSPNHRIQGGGYSMPQLPLLDPSHIDGYLQVTDQDAAHMARRLAKEEGIFAGFSSGANVVAAVQLLETRCRGQTVAVLINDSALKYLSTDLFE